MIFAKPQINLADILMRNIPLFFSLFMGQFAPFQLSFPVSFHSRNKNASLATKPTLPSSGGGVCVKRKQRVWRQRKAGDGKERVTVWRWSRKSRRTALLEGKTAAFNPIHLHPTLHGHYALCDL